MNSNIIEKLINFSFSIKKVSHIIYIYYTQGDIFQEFISFILGDYGCSESNTGTQGMWWLLSPLLVNLPRFLNELCFTILKRLLLMHPHPTLSLPLNFPFNMLGYSTT